MRYFLLSAFMVCGLTAPSQAASPFPCGTPDVCANLWVAAHDVGSMEAFFVKDSQTIKPSDIHPGDKLFANTDINVRLGPANWQKEVFVLNKGRNIIVAETRALTVPGHKPQLWLRITDPVSQTNTTPPPDGTVPGTRMPCDLSPAFSKAKTKGTLDFSGKTIPYESSLRFDFQPLETGLVRVTETDDIQMQNADDRIRETISDKTSSVPKDTCDTNIVITSITSWTESGKIKSQVGFKGEKWACISWELPCPTWNDLSRFCRQEAKSIIGEGTGTITVWMDPIPTGESVTIKTSSNTDFRLDDKSRFIGDLMSGLLIGPVGTVAFEAFGSLMEAKIKEFGYKDSQVINPGANDENENWSPTITSASFSSYANASQGTSTLPSLFRGVVTPISFYIEHGITLRLVREQELKPGAACYVKETL